MPSRRVFKERILREVGAAGGDDSGALIADILELSDGGIVTASSIFAMVDPTGPSASRTTASSIRNYVLGISGGIATIPEAVVISGTLHVGAASAGAPGVSATVGTNFSLGEGGAGTSLATFFRQANSGATVLSNGYRYTPTANGFASSYASSWAKSALVLGYASGDLRFYADAAATAAVGTDVVPTLRFTLAGNGDATFTGAVGGITALTTTTLQVGNLSLSGNTISSTSGGITIAPLSTKRLVVTVAGLDGVLTLNGSSTSAGAGGTVGAIWLDQTRIGGGNNATLIGSSATLRVSADSESMYFINADGQTYDANGQTNSVAYFLKATVTGAATNYGFHLTAALNYLSGVLGIGIAQSTSATLTLAAGTIAKSSIRLPHGVAPTSPVDGDLWSTTAGFYGQVSGATVGPFGAGGGSGLTQPQVMARTLGC